MSFPGDIYLHKAPGRDVTVFRESLVWKQPVKATRPVSDYVAKPTIYNDKVKKRGRIQVTSHQICEVSVTFYLTAICVLE